MTKMRSLASVHPFPSARERVLLSDDISAIAYGVAFRPCMMSHFVYSHWLAQPPFLVLAFSPIFMYLVTHSINHYQLTLLSLHTSSYLVHFPMGGDQDHMINQSRLLHLWLFMDMSSHNSLFPISISDLMAPAQEYLSHLKEYIDNYSAIAIAIDHFLCLHFK